MDAPISISSSTTRRPTIGIRARITNLFTALKQPERWVLLSACDWYPDPSHYPTNHAALLKLDTSEADRA